MSRLAQDTHYTYVKLGYPNWSTLEKVPGKDIYRQEIPYGGRALSIQPIPNKAWDMVNKATETLLADFPQVECQPINDGEISKAACDLANRFLEQDASEQGTNDAILWNDRVAKALVCCSSYIEYWVDPTGGGYVPLQILAHPAATSADDPFIGPDGNTTADNILRYVTPQRQFTDDPSQAAPQWQPRIRASKWDREHLRVYPETATIDTAEKVIILGWCTLSEGRRRWKIIDSMSPGELDKLCDWTPDRYLPLLPPHLRNRWKLTDGKTRQKAGSSDERVFFWYRCYIRACPDYPKGADVLVSGMAKGKILEKDTLATMVATGETKETHEQPLSDWSPPIPDLPQQPEEPSDDPQKDMLEASQEHKEVRCMEIPIVGITPISDPDEGEPSGRSFIEMGVGAVQNNAYLASAFSNVVDRNLHLPGYTDATSPVNAAQRENARATGAMIPVMNLSKDKVQWESPVPIDETFVRMYEMADEAVNSIYAQNKPAQGSDKQQEVSGTARSIAISQNNIANTSKVTAVNHAYARSCRIKVELAMKFFTTPQMIGYIGEDGAYAQREWTGVDFALVGRVVIKTGTGTMMNPSQKVQYAESLAAAKLLTSDEVASIVRPAFSKQLGLGPDPHEQYVKRCIGAWLAGPPKPKPAPPPQPDPVTGQPVQQPPPPSWQDQYKAWKTAQQQYQQAQQQFQQAQQQYQQYLLNQAIFMAGPPVPTLGPEEQNQKGSVQFEQAKIALQLAVMQNPNIAQPPQPPQPPQVPKPWLPFEPRPNDTEPGIAAMWTRETSLLMSSTKWGQFGPEWQDVLSTQYTLTRQALATGQAAQAGGAPASPAHQGSKEQEKRQQKEQDTHTPSQPRGH